MKKTFLKILLISCLLLVTPAQASEETVNLSVPFTPEVPDNKWIAPWNNACEEAAIVMVQEYYQGKETMDKTEAKNLMNPLFKIENGLFGSNADTDAARTNRLINEYSSFGSKIVDNPTLEQIKTELVAGRPVITFLYGKDLVNPNHRWRTGGSYYHVMTLVGFDDNTEEFIANDSGDYYTGLDYRYKYDTILNALHDFDHKIKKANGPARVLFTWSKRLAKTATSGKIYLISHRTKQHISSPELFKIYNWKWSEVKTVSSDWLNKLETGPKI